MFQFKKTLRVQANVTHDFELLCWFLDQPSAQYAEKRPLPSEQI